MTSPSVTVAVSQAEKSKAGGSVSAAQAASSAPARSAPACSACTSAAAERIDGGDARAQALAPHQGGFANPVAQPLRRLGQAGVAKQVRGDQAGDRKAAADHRGAGAETEREAVWVFAGQPREAGQIGLGVGGAAGAVQCPLGARHVAQVRRTSDSCVVRLQEARQRVAPLREVAPAGRVRVPEVSREQLEVLGLPSMAAITG